MIELFDTLASTLTLQWETDIVWVVINSHLRMHLQIWRQSTDSHNVQMVYLNRLMVPNLFTGRYCTSWIRSMLNRGKPSKHKNCYNAYTLFISEICDMIKIYLRFIPMTGQQL